MIRRLDLLSLVCLLFLSTSARAADVRVAVASNFLIPLKTIASEYERETGDHIVIIAGSTGKLYAQIVNGAPFDVFLAANSREPERLEKEGYAVNGSRFTYALGTLVLWDPNAQFAQDSAFDVLKTADYKRLSLANPGTAPYGAAAVSVLAQLGLNKNAGRKLLRGEIVSQAYQYLASGAADLGFVALSQIKARGDHQGRFWILDSRMHEPITQQAVLLAATPDKARAKRFLAYLQSSKGRLMIENFGYGLP